MDFLRERKIEEAIISNIVEENVSLGLKTHADIQRTNSTSEKMLQMKETVHFLLTS